MAEVEVESADGSRSHRLSLPLAPAKPLFGDWPRGDSRLLEGIVGYLRIARMDDDPAFVDSILAALDRFAGARGLVIDVRGNGGGCRVLIPRLFSRFLGSKDPPRIGNVAASRLREGEDPARPGGYLADRFLFPASSPHWSPVERRAVEAFARSFRPAWTPPSGEFSRWHYFVIAPPASAAPFGAPVVVLMDDGCFSATDIFLGTFKGWRKVTFLRTPSGGGSGRARPATLARSGIRVQLSSMASFRPDGTLYDGEGVEPDVLVEREPEDLVGKGDAQLASALARLGR
ncbi:MAG: S41 family peptidase [Planctomycetota bacterium]